MARIRTIKPEFPQSESIGRLSREARLLFILLWTLVDDSGRARAASRLLASLLYPFDEDSRGLVEGWLDELAQNGHVRLYVVDGTSYLDIPKWLQHQKIDRPSPSHLPPFDEASTKPREDAANTRRGLAAVSRTVDLGPRTVDPPIAPPSHEQTILTFPCNGTPNTWALTEAQVDEWAALYVGVDVQGECAKALAWLQANNRKTAKGMKRFLVGWLNRANDQPRSRSAATRATAAPTPRTPAPCTCGEGYRNSFDGRCITCEGKPSFEQIDRRNAEPSNA